MDDSREAFGVDRRRILAAAGLGGLGSIAALPTARAQSQSWPNKPIRLITGFPAGSATDGISRAWPSICARCWASR